MSIHLSAKLSSSEVMSQTGPLLPRYSPVKLGINMLPPRLERQEGISKKIVSKKACNGCDKLLYESSMCHDLCPMCVMDYEEGIPPKSMIFLFEDE